MDKPLRKSYQYAKRHSIIKPSNNNSKITAQKESYEKGLSNIFSSPPSHLGYSYSIESLINELELKNEQLLNYTISSLSKIVRNKNETRIIASYLYLMPNFIKLLKGQEINKKEEDILKELLNLSQSMSYEKYQQESILMRFGDKGSTAYVILDGKVDVLIKTFKNMYITKNDYLFYLANLLKYSEYGLLTEVINENFLVFPIEIYDSQNIKHLNFNSLKNSPIKEENIHTKTQKNTSEYPMKNDNLFSNSKTFNNLEEENDKHNSSFNSLFKLNEENEQIKELKKIFSISINSLLKMFGLKKLDKKNTKLNNCTLNEYISRIELVPDHYKMYINKTIMNTISNKTETENDNDKDKKSYLKKEDTDNDSEEENKIYNLKIFTYSKVATLGKGTLFGEIALRDAKTLRTGTLITASECHFTVLSKRIFDNCLKKGAEKYLKELLTFFINLPVFIGIPESLFYHKYYTFLSKKVILRGNFLITQGEKPKNIILLQTGSYGLTTRISLFDLTKLIYHFINLNLKNKNNIYDEDTDKYNRFLKRIKNFMNEAKALMNENLKFKKFYLSEIFIRVTDISCPDIVGYKEYIDENGLYAFSIETKSPENIIFTLDNKLYSDLQHRNYTVRLNQKELLEKKINVIIQRLLIIRNSLVNSYFEDKGEKQIGALIMKELESINNIKLRQKRFLKFKSTEYKFNKLEDKEYEFNKSNNNFFFDKEKEKSKKIKIISRNYKLYKNDNDHFNSFNEAEERKKKLKKNISQYYKINTNKNIKINKKVLNLYKASKNFYSAKKNIENNKQIIKKKYLIDADSKEKEKMQKSNLTLKEYSEKYKFNLNNNTETNSKEKREINNIKNDNIFGLYSPKISSANYSSRNSEIKCVMFNSLVWEEIKTKINKKIIMYNKDILKNMNHTQRNKKFINIFEKSNSFKKINNEEIKTPYNTGRYKSSKIHLYNKHSLLHKSASESFLKNSIRIKSNLIKKLKSQKDISSYELSKRNNHRTIDNNNFNKINKYFIRNERNRVPKINLKIKKFFSPEQIKLIREINKKRNDLNILKYHESKFEKYRIDRNFYYNNNLKNRMKLFYNIEKK